MMWSEKYHPTRLSECVLDHIDDESQNLLQQAVTAASPPNLLLHGPPGTGKTTIAGILCDPERFELNSFNGSIFGKSDLALLQQLGRSRSLFHDKRCILVDEIDSLTRNAQKALRALMDEDSVDVVWVCTGNKIRDIILPLQSRVILVDCSYSIRAKREAHFAGIGRRCRHILSAEGVRDISDEDLRHVVELHYPDIRKTINSLQRKCVPHMRAHHHGPETGKSSKLDSAL